MLRNLTSPLVDRQIIFVREYTQCILWVHQQNYISKYIKLVILELCSDHFLAGFASQGVVNKDPTVKNLAYRYDMCE